MSSNSEAQAHHVVLFPFMSKGHTVPILHLAHLLLRRGHAVTVFTTAANRPFIAHSLAHTSASVINLPFPQNVADDIPAGIESTDKLPSTSMFHSFANGTKPMQPAFERALETLPRVSFIVSDWFLWWTQEPASKFNIPRFVFHGMSYYSRAVSRAVAWNRLLFGVGGPESDDELITVDPFPWIKVTRNDFEQHFKDPEPKMGKEVRKMGKHLAVMAKKAVEDGGSSRRTMDLLIDVTCRKETCLVPCASSGL